jgi:hypothetical protein
MLVRVLGYDMTNMDAVGKIIASHSRLKLQQTPRTLLGSIFRPEDFFTGEQQQAIARSEPGRHC